MTISCVNSQSPPTTPFQVQQPAPKPAAQSGQPAQATPATGNGTNAVSSTGATTATTLDITV